MAIATDRAGLDFSNLTLGAPAAERDITQGLADYFVESEAFRRVAEGPKRIVLGNRGTGKSAIFKVLAERRRKAKLAVIELAPEDYSYEMLTAVLAGEAEGAWAKHGAYAVAWKYLVYVLVMRAVVGDATKIQRGAVGRIQRYLRDSHGDLQGSKLSVLVAYLKRLEGVKIGPVEASLKTRELDRMYKLDELTPLMDDLREALKSRPVVVLVDELDRGWDASEDAKAFVSGLFQACAKLNELSPHLQVYMSLRQELYDSIPALYEDAQKARDMIETIAWDEPTLLNLVANRIRYRIEKLKKASDDDCWSAVFADTLQYRQNKSFNYIVDRTLYRPREIIEFGTRAIEVAQNRGAPGFPIDYSVITQAEIDYSKARIDDLSAEYRFQYPGLDSVFEVFRGRTYLVDRTALEEICFEMATGDLPTDESTAAWLADTDADDLIEILWRVGFLRARAVGGIKARRRSGSSYLGSHQVGTLNLHGISQFQVHPMFRSYLGMKEPKGAKS
ncbi:MAG TPA: hypothetical protein VF549_16885 [Solirubrobacteraceae bacterium]